MPQQTCEQWQQGEQERGIPLQDRSLLLGDPAAASAVLLLHGAGATPADFLEIATLLAADGFHCFAPLLPAHGQGPEEMGALRFTDLLGRAVEAWDVLAAHHQRVFLVGQSLGAVLGIPLAAQKSPAGFVALAPALRPIVGKRALRILYLLVAHPRLARATFRWQTEVRNGIRETAPQSARIACPLLVLHSERDASVSVEGARRLHEQAVSADKELVLIEDDTHALTEAPERRTRVIDPVRSFLQRLSAPESRTET